MHTCVPHTILCSVITHRHTQREEGREGERGRERERETERETYTDPAVIEGSFGSDPCSRIRIEHFTNQLLCFLCNCVPFRRWKLKKIITSSVSSYRTYT